MRLPDVTLAQVVAAVTWVVGQVVAMGLLNADTSRLVLQTAVTVISAAWVLADAWIRHGRSKIAAAAIMSPNDTATELNKVAGTHGGK